MELEKFKRSMLRRRFVSTVAAIALALFGCGENETDQSSQNINTGSVDWSADRENPLNQLHMADQLAEYAQDRRDPIALALAARIYLEVAPQGKEANGNSVELSDLSKAERMLQEAGSWSPDDQFVTALIEDIRAVKPKGRKGRPLFTEGKALPGKVIELTETFEGKTSAGVYIQSQPHGQILLKIYDEDNQLICEAESVLNRSLCFWTPKEESIFRIKIINTSSIDAVYSLYTD